MTKTMAATILAIILGAMPANAAKASYGRAGVRHPTGQTIIIYTGTVDSKSAERLTNLIAANTDKIIGLKISVEKSTDADSRYYTDLSDNQLNITSGDPMDAPVEVLINDGVGTTTAGAFYTADGFYLIKSGGSHAAGALSYGAISVSEATIRLNPHIHLITRPF